MKLRNYFNQKKLHCLQKPSKQRFDNIYKAKILCKKAFLHIAFTLKQNFVLI